LIDGDYAWPSKHGMLWDSGDDIAACSAAEPHDCTFTKCGKLAHHAIMVSAHCTLKGTMGTCRLCAGANKSTFVNGLPKGQFDIQKPLVQLLVVNMHAHAHFCSTLFDKVIVAGALPPPTSHLLGVSKSPR
jgi:hypothetical protein